jgi:hypothetical protein
MTGVEEARRTQRQQPAARPRPPTAASPRRSSPPWPSPSAAPARASPPSSSRPPSGATSRTSRCSARQGAGRGRRQDQRRGQAVRARRAPAALEGQQQATFDQAQKDLGTAPTIIEGAGDGGNVSSDYLNAKADTALTEGNRLTAIARELSKTRAPGQLMTRRRPAPREPDRRALGSSGAPTSARRTPRARRAERRGAVVRQPREARLGGGQRVPRLRGAGAAIAVGGRRRRRHGAAGRRLPGLDHRRGAVRPAARRAVHLRPRRAARSASAADMPRSPSPSTPCRARRPACPAWPARSAGRRAYDAGYDQGLTPSRRSRRRSPTSARRTPRPTRTRRWPTRRTPRRAS